MTDSKLMGFVRKTKNGNAVTLSVDIDAFNNADKYSTKAGKKYVRMLINLDKLNKLLKDEINFATISQIIN